MLNQRPKDTPQILPFRTLQKQPSILHQANALFRTLPEQLSMFHHACVPPNPCYELYRYSSPDYNDYTTHGHCFELCRCSFHHHHKRLMTQFFKPILIECPRRHLLKFQCSAYRRQKRLHFEPLKGLARRHRPIKTWLRPSLHKCF